MIIIDEAAGNVQARQHVSLRVSGQTEIPDQ